MTEELQASPAVDWADVTVLEESHAPAPGETPVEPVRFSAAILLLEQPFMDIRSGHQVAVGVALKIETADAVWLGEAERCTPSPGLPNHWTVRVHLRHVLRDFETLSRLAERFGLPPVKGAPVRSR